MAPLSKLGSILAFGQAVLGLTSTSPSSGTAVSSGTTSTYSEAFTIPASADVGANLLPNIQDPVSF